MENLWKLQEQLKYFTIHTKYNSLPLGFHFWPKTELNAEARWIKLDDVPSKLIFANAFGGDGGGDKCAIFLFE